VRYVESFDEFWVWCGPRQRIWTSSSNNQQQSTFVDVFKLCLQRLSDFAVIAICYLLPLRDSIYAVRLPTTITFTKERRRLKGCTKQLYERISYFSAAALHQALFFFKLMITMFNFFCLGGHAHQTTPTWTRYRRLPCHSFWLGEWWESTWHARWHRFYSEF